MNKITNTKLIDKQVMENYKNLWHIEKAFRMSKTDLRIRPIYHRLQSRIEAHICISFTAYCIYKELERILYKEKSTLSLKKAAEVTHNMYEISYTLPESKHTKTKLLKMDDEQAHLYQKYSEKLLGCPNAENKGAGIIQPHDLSANRVVELYNYFLSIPPTIFCTITFYPNYRVKQKLFCCSPAEPKSSSDLWLNYTYNYFLAIPQQLFFARLP